MGREAYVEGTRNMDLLLGILVYAACESARRNHRLRVPEISWGLTFIYAFQGLAAFFRATHFSESCAACNSDSI
jgi:hypothetical protein